MAFAEISLIPNFTKLDRHGRACQRKSGLPDLRHSNSATLGQA
jgi:hypothetical protein